MSVEHANAQVTGAEINLKEAEEELEAVAARPIPVCWKKYIEQQQAANDDDESSDTETTTTEDDVGDVDSVIAKGNEWAEQNPEQFKQLLDRSTLLAVITAVQAELQYFPSSSSK